ncbi:IS1249 family transposase [Rothia sp. SD9660Na]|nr:IS1249 family transposase [Rothia sp. SD9660Na]WHS51513.1 IS1249 family transposase [Rothia sp. SD9660Na]
MCNQRTKRNGTTSAGTTRYRCTHCGASRTIKRPTSTRKHQLAAFITWLTSKNTQQHTTLGAGRTFRANTAWCWNITPPIKQTGQIHHEIQLDGIYISGMVCIIAYNHSVGVIDYQWAKNENTAAYQALLSRIPAPDVAIVDGGAGFASAAKTCWPETRIQRCLVHIYRNTRALLTSAPRTEAGKSLLKISRALLRVTSLDEAAIWSASLASWHSQYQGFIKERTWLSDGSWQYTHERVRTAYRRLERLVKQGVVFTFLDSDLLREGPISRTTNHIEGYNAKIRAMLREHRGMPVEHQWRAVGWLLWVDAAWGASVDEVIRLEPVPVVALAGRRKEAAVGRSLDELRGVFVVGEGVVVRRGWGGRGG